MSAWEWDANSKGGKLLQTHMKPGEVLVSNMDRHHDDMEWDDDEEFKMTGDELAKRLNQKSSKSSILPGTARVIDVAYSVDGKLLKNCVAVVGIPRPPKDK